jgi:hypothetical protein
MTVKPDFNMFGFGGESPQRLPQTSIDALSPVPGDHAPAVSEIYAAA